MLVGAGGAPLRAQPTHCEAAAPGEGPWPAIGEPAAGADATPITRGEARRVVRAFRRHWSHVPHEGHVLALFTECMMASEQHFTVRRVSRTDIAQTLRSPAVTLVGSPDALPELPWAWEVYWGGASRRIPPSGPISAFLTPDLAHLVAAVQHLEG